MPWRRALSLPPLLILTALAGAALGEPGVWRGHGISMYGDLKYSADFEHFDYVNPEAPKGGELRRAVAPAAFDSFNPFILKGTPAAGQAYLFPGLLYDTLTVRTADEPSTQYGLLAETIETPEDRSWVAFTLREGARWHDGRPITVEDVIWSFETLMEKGQPVYRFYYGNVDKVEKVGPRKVRFSFKPGENRELPLILGEFPILPRHYWAGRKFDETILEPPLGSGPYKIGPFEAGRFVVYERVPDYWGAGLPVNVGKYNFDRMRFTYYRDVDVAIEALKGGEYDLRAENNSKKWATAYEIPEVKNGSLQMDLIPNDRTQGMQGFVFNMRRELFKDRRVRQALAYAFDFEWSNKTLFYGQYTRTRSYFDNSELAARGLPSAAELAILEPYRGRIPDEVFTEAYEPPSTDGSGNIRANLKQATKLLAEAGWSVKDGVLTHGETGRKMEFEFLIFQPGFDRIVLPFTKNLERIGIRAKLRSVDASQYRRRMDEFDFDMTVGSFGQSESPGNEQRDFWSSEAAGREGSRNLMGIRDPVIDELIELVISAPDRETLVTRVRALDRVLQWGHYLIPNWHIEADRIVYWNKFGRPSITPAQGVQIDAWWFDPQRAAALPKRARGGA